MRLMVLVEEDHRYVLEELLELACRDETDDGSDGG